MNASPATFAAQVAKARKANVPPFGGDRRAYTSETGMVRTEWVTRYDHEHVMSEFVADLPGDRSIGYCECGEYLDTGTFDERNA
jgi:hypothetical protein